MTSLHFAAWAGNVRVLPTLIRAKSFHPDEPDADGWTPLHFAAMAGHPEAVRLLLAHGARVNARTKYGSPPVMLAGASPFTVLSYLDVNPTVLSFCQRSQAARCNALVRV